MGDPVFEDRDLAIEHAIELAWVEARIDGAPVSFRSCIGDPCQGGGPCDFCERFICHPDGSVERERQRH